MKIKRTEQETVIDFFAQNKNVTLFSEDETIIRKIRGYAEAYPDDVTFMRDTETAISVVIPRKWVKIIPPPKRKPLTEERRLATIERLRRAREAHKQREQE